MLKHSLPPRKNEELKVLLDNNDTETIILCHIRLAYSLSKKFGKDDEYFDSAIFGLVQGVSRLKDLPHDNITGYLVCWMNRYLREVKAYTPSVDLDVAVDCDSDFEVIDLIQSLPQLDMEIITLLLAKYTNKEICEELETTQWYITKAKSHLKTLLNKVMVK
jgi:hypothetical protein